MKQTSLWTAVLVFLVLLGRGASAAAPDVIPHAQDKMPGPPLSPAEAIRKMTVPEGFTVELVAAEPDIVNPVAMTFDERGRIWITESLEYPRLQPGPGRDRIKILEDTDHDGKADKITVFAEGLNIPSGIAVGHGGVWVANAPDLLFLKDTDGDDRADEREVVATGFGRFDTHELPNSFTWGPDGWLYGLNGVFNPSLVEQNGKRFEFTCALFRIHPRTREFQLFAEGTSNPWGVAWDNEGSAFISACVIDHLWHLAESGYYIRQGGPYPPHTWPMRSIVKHKHQKAAYCGIHYFDSDAYPEEYRRRLYMGNIHGNCINVDVLERDGSGYAASGAPDFLTANDAWFMPVVQKTGPDGCLYILDWYDRYHCYQDARRDSAGIDRLKGRLYRVRYQGTPRAARFDLSTETDERLIERLHSPNVFFRDVAQRVLCERNNSGTRPRLERLVLNNDAPRKARMHALWTLAGAGSLAVEFHQALLEHADAGFRAWGVRAAGNFGQIDNSLRTKIVAMSDDPADEVRLQVAICAKKIEGIDAMPLLIRVLAQSDDDELIRHIVWQNLHPLLEKHGPRYMELVSGEEYSASPVVASLLPRVIDRVLDSRDTSSMSEFLKRLASDGKADAPWLEKCFATLTARLHTRQLTAGQLAELRPQLDPLVQHALVRPNHDALYANAALLAATWKDARAVTAVRGFFADRNQPAERRAQALAALVAADDDALEKTVREFLADAEAGPVQLRAAALDSLSRADGAWVAEVILETYPQLEPELRPRAIEVLAQRRAWAEQLLDAIGRAAIPASALNANQVRQLIAGGDASLVAKVEARWGSLRGTRDPKREEVIARIRPFLRKTPGNPMAGIEVFNRVCGQCHKLHGQGQDVGPDITVNGRNSFEQLLSNVFDPSLVIGAAYQARTILTEDGRVLTGLVAEDSDRRVVLKIQGGKQETIPRAEIAAMKTSQLSLMPEDLEKQLKPDELANLFAYITLDKPPTDPGARKLAGSQLAQPRETSDPAAFAGLVGEIAPGFTAARVGKPGLAIVAQHCGRQGVLRTQPVHRQAPAIVHRRLKVPDGKRTRLVVAVSHESAGQWKLTVVANRQEIHQSLIGGQDAAPKWQTVSVDLTPLAGKTINLGLLNASAGEGPHTAYWAQIDIVSE